MLDAFARASLVRESLFYRRYKYFLESLIDHRGPRETSEEEELGRGLRKKDFTPCRSTNRSKQHHGDHTINRHTHPRVRRLSLQVISPRGIFFTSTRRQFSRFSYVSVAEARVVCASISSRGDKPTRDTRSHAQLGGSNCIPETSTQNNGDMFAEINLSLLSIEHTHSLVYR